MNAKNNSKSKKSSTNSDNTTSPISVFYCDNCRYVPKITLLNPTEVEIKCICENEPYRLPIKEFLKISMQKKKFPKCTGIENVKNCKNEAIKFCTVCQSWFCPDCLKLHNNSSEYNNHDLISNGILTGYFCEENSHDHQKSEYESANYYCETCEIHICDYCLELHKEHDYVELDQIFTENDLNLYSQELKSIEQKLQEIQSMTDEVINDLKNTILGIEEAFNRNMEINNDMLDFCKVLVNDFVSINGLGNFYARSNLSNNKLSFNLKNQNVLKDLATQLNNTLSFFNNDILLKTQEMVKTQEIDDKNPKGESNISDNNQKSNIEASKINDNKINPDISKLETINSFSVVYNITNANEETRILGDMYRNFNENNSEMFIDGKQVSFRRDHIFKTNGIHKMKLNCKKKVRNLSWLFFNCPTITHIEIGNWDTSEVESLSGAFCGCTNLTRLNIANWDTSNVKDMSLLFSQCTSLSALNVSEWDTSKCQDFSWMFGECKNLSYMDISKWNTSSAKNLSGMFYECEILYNIDLSKWDTTNVTNLSKMFYGCKRVSKIDASNWNVSKVNDFSSMFYKCGKLASINLNNWNVKKDAYCNAMFYGCAKLENWRKNFKDNRENCIIF